MKILHSNTSASPTHLRRPISSHPHPPILTVKSPSLKPNLHVQHEYNTLLLPKPTARPQRVPSPARKEPTNDTNTTSDVLRLMDGLGLPVTPDIYASLVAECTQNRDCVRAVQLVTHLRRNRGMVGFVSGANGLGLLNRVLMMLVRCGSLDVACKVFDKMPQRDYISLAIVLAGFVNEEFFEEALDLFVRMYRVCGGICNSKCWELLPLRLVMVCVLEACGQLEDVELGQLVHGLLVKVGSDRELLVGIALMEFYGRCGCLQEANLVFFDQIEMADRCGSKVWNVAIVNNSRYEQCFDEVVWIFREMGRAGVRKNSRTFSNVFKACGRASDGELYGKQVHANAIKLALDTRVSVMSSLIDMYGKFGLLEDARKVFDGIAWEERSMACWNAIVTGFMNNGWQIEAIKLLYEMKAAGVEPQQSLIKELVVAFGSEKLSMDTNNGSILKQENAK